MKLVLLVTLCFQVLSARSVVRTMSDCLSCLGGQNFVCAQRDTNRYAFCCDNTEDTEKSGCMETASTNYQCSTSLSTDFTRQMLCPLEETNCNTGTAEFLIEP